MVRIKYFTSILSKILLLVLLAFNKAESNICQDNKPCLGRGGCFIIEETSQPSFLSTKCVCAKGYSGRWCHFVEDGFKWKLNDYPGAPKILPLSRNSYERSYNLTWKESKESLDTPVLYYALRYRMVGESKWKNVDEIFAMKTQTIYSYVLKSLQYEENYEVEIYAGSSHGVGKHATVTIEGPKIDYPVIMDTSEDKTGDNAILENTMFTLECKVHGKPRTTLSWTLDGKTLSSGRKFDVSKGILTVLRASTRHHQGVYRCVAKNRWGTVMSRRIQVQVTAKVKFRRSTLNHNTSKTKEVVIGMPAIFVCPALKQKVCGLSYKWGNRYENSSNDYIIKTSTRVWITVHGQLIFHEFQPSDASLINKKGLRCIIEQRTSSGMITIMSKIFKLSIQQPGLLGFPWLAFYDKPPKTITILRGGDSLQLQCSAYSTLPGDVSIEWIIYPSASNTKFPSVAENKTTGVHVYGRVLNVHKVLNLQKLQSGKILCKASQLKQDKSGFYRIKTETVFKVLDGPENVYENLPGKLFVYGSSALSLGPSRSHFPVSWYFNGVRMTNKKSFLELGRSTAANSGFYQVDVIFGKTSYTAPVYIHFDDVLTNESIPARPGLQLYCVPPATVSLHDMNITFAPSCGSKTVHNIITITQETAWRHEICSCKAQGSLFSVERKLDMDFDGAMFSSSIGRWVWSQWSPWSNCPNIQELCGQNSFSSRHRSCYNPNQNLDGEYCSGNEKQKQSCPFIPCRKKVPSFWAPWSIWSDCSNLCGSGTRSRRRMCIAPSEKPCPEGDWYETKKCLGSFCSNVGKDWSEWSEWSDCSKSCGMGTRIRRRQCSGQRCLGRAKENMSCHTSCKDEVSLINEIYSKGIFYLPNAVALGTAIFLIGLAISLAICNCRKKSLKKSKHERLLQDLFSKADLDVEREPLLETDKRPPQAKKRPPSKEHRHASMTKPANSRPGSIGNVSSTSLAPATPLGSLPPPSPSLLAPIGGIASLSSAGGKVPPPLPAPVRGAGPSASPPPPPPPPPGPKR